MRVRLSKQIYRGLHHRCPNEGGDCGTCEVEAARITMGLMESLPQIRELLLADVQAAYDGDPAASSIDEVIFCYPGVCGDQRLPPGARAAGSWACRWCRAS